MSLCKQFCVCVPLSLPSSAGGGVELPPEQRKHLNPVCVLAQKGSGSLLQGRLFLTQSQIQVEFQSSGKRSERQY